MMHQVDEKQKLVKYKILQNVKKRFIIIIRKYFNLENFTSFQEKV